jgi:Icc-related predicted phosphoesterase
LEEQVLLISADLHGSDDAIELLKDAERRLSPSVILICGDLTTYGSRRYMDKLLKSFSSPLLAVPGNCDTQEMLEMMEEAEVSLHLRRRKLGSLDLFGFGGGLPSPADMPFEVEEGEMVSGLRSVAVRAGVMVTHTPPFGANDLDRNGMHAGSRGLREIADQFEPRAVVSGHIHEGRGILEENGVVYVNPGPARGGFYAVLRLGDKVRAELS